MSHVISSQPSSTSPYKPTGTEIVDELPTTIITGETRKRRDCCCDPDNSDGCCLSIVCRPFGQCFRLIGDVTESCCDSFANCIGNCCDDKPKDQNRRYNQYNYADTGFNDNPTSMDNRWLVGIAGNENRDDDYNNDRTEDVTPVANCDVSSMITYDHTAKQDTADDGNRKYNHVLDTIAHVTQVANVASSMTNHDTSGNDVGAYISGGASHSYETSTGGGGGDSGGGGGDSGGGGGDSGGGGGDSGGGGGDSGGYD